MSKLELIFKTKRPLIGMIHFAPLVGYSDHPGFDYIAKRMLKEAKILEKAGFDGIIIENNYDIPHTEKISPKAAAMFRDLARLLQINIKIPFGISVLWNDFETALSICNSTKAKFFRVPAFVDTVETNYGIMPARAKEIIKLKHKLKLNKVAIFADVQVKHSKMLNKEKSLKQSVKEAGSKGADAIIVTGKWTGDAPAIEKLKNTREAAGDCPVLIGSGATVKNLSTLSKYADGVIVGTALKEGSIHSKEVNLKPYTAEISFQKAKVFASKFRKTFQ